MTTPRRTTLQKSVGVAEKVLDELAKVFADDDPSRVGDPIPRERIQHRIGAQVVLDGFVNDSGNVPMDCAGLVWVTVIRRYRTRQFPAELYESTNCAAPRAITIQLGIARCSAMIDEYGSAPDPLRIQHEAIRGLDDAYRLDLALCRAAKVLEDEGYINGIAVDYAEPMGPEGGVVSWVQQASFQL